MLALCTYNVAGYIARKLNLPSSCELCKPLCFVSKENVPSNQPAETCIEWDLGGLLYPSEPLYRLIQTLEDKLTSEFIKVKLHAKVVKEFVHGIGRVASIGCSEHSLELTQTIVKFYDESAFFSERKEPN
ncbi:unnamed protein product [Ixodes persulcatus]